MNTKGEGDNIIIHLDGWLSLLSESRGQGAAVCCGDTGLVCIRSLLAKDPLFAMSIQP